MLRNQLPKNSKHLMLLVRLKEKKNLFSDTLYPYKFGMSILAYLMLSNKTL